MHRHLITLALLTASALPPFTGVSGPPSAAAADRPGSDGVGIRPAEVPADARSDPRARRHIVDHLSPGAVVHRRIEVSNTSDVPVRVALYAAAAAIDRGMFSVSDGRTPNELSAWTSIGPRVLSLGPHSRSPATVTVAVPGRAAAGERYAVIWAETAGEAPYDGAGEVNRVGIRMYLSVGPGGGPPTDFTVDSLTARRTREGRPVVLARVRNTGGRALDLSGDLRLTEGPGGVRAGPFGVVLGTTLAPGGSDDVTVPLDDGVPDGPWQALLRLRSGTARHAARATILFPHDAGTAAAVPAETDTRQTVLAAALALGVAGLGATLLRRGRRPAARR
ncbi:hypothetical protein GCM10017673_30760 [Streptosporangium violaceochromogenes]|nr:hypothetical protein GCM10017673_30760 [Streptosporangium violaceochromogenes]